MPGLGATDPADLEAQARAELGFLRRLEQPRLRWARRLSCVVSRAAAPEVQCRGGGRRDRGGWRRRTAAAAAAAAAAAGRG